MLALGRTALFLAAGLAATAVVAQNIPAQPVRTVEVRPGIAVLYGVGGNIGVSYGDDGTLLVDDQFAPMVPGIKQAVADLGATPARFVINTHWHWDHAAGNAGFGKEGAIIMAHDTVRQRIAEGGSVMGIVSEPGAPEALPIVTYDKGLTLHLNGDDLDVLFIGGGHTDGDSVVRWRKANVLHMGDMFMKGQGWPVIDTGSGGNVLTFLASLDRALALTDEETLVIPGHGELGTRADLVAFRDMIAEGSSRVTALRVGGLSLEQAQAEKPLAGLSPDNTYVDDDAFVQAVWESL